ncbi:hypothetical protein TVAG_493800 [Trichomonas vaginalis G3]|uniref:Uncharacterized protein n=1 Tax=Trichomonas vaginalis (strain ATCC PRA-98 / G3) TaxID=412133 RepID=A2DQ11_TRIV3|nr:hypothetical protein TVAGG3_0384550 [Trichomonas vaginalis G3]EAY17438.1 hypothetical protein TVAG_493800 [Trichomonas vaginalis G3]KAI5533533.1 hypothetical protein TVAGG3_0384550 [Trichomonas vaginalis G3]|eukprot:XP_001329573.1 hypothetical protein [Trichomonas vaginalis G3]
MSQVQREHKYVHAHRMHSVERREHVRHGSRNLDYGEEKTKNKSYDSIHQSRHRKNSPDDSENQGGDSEIQKWRTTFDLLIQLIGKTTENPPVLPNSDEQRRALLVDMTGEICRKAINPTESTEYKVLLEKYEHQKRKSERLRKRTEKMLTEVEDNRNRLEEHMRKVQKGEKTETDRILKSIDQLMAEQAKNHRQFLKSSATLSSPKSKPRRSYDSDSRSSKYSSEVTSESDE